MTMNRWQLWTLTAAALAVPATAIAQDIAPALDPGVMVGWAGGEAVRYDNQRRSGGRSAVRPQARGLNVRSLASSFQSGATTSLAPTAAASLTYQPSAAQRKANLAKFVERSRELDPENAANLQKMLQQNDVIGIANGWMKQYGMSASNVADATAVYLAGAWLATRGSTADPDPATMRALRNQVASAMVATPSFRSATNAEKQELAEAMIVQSLVASKFVDAARSQPQTMQSVKDAVAKGAKNTFGFDLRAMNLTARGLR